MQISTDYFSKKKSKVNQSKQKKENYTYQHKNQWNRKQNREKSFQTEKNQCNQKLTLCKINEQRKFQPVLSGKKMKEEINNQYGG